MAVRADQGLARDTEAFQMDLVADTVTRPGEVDAVFFGDGADKAVVVRIFKAGLKGVVIDVSHRPFGFDPFYPHGFKFQISHGAGGVLCQCLIDAKADFFAHLHLSVDQMVFYNFLSDGVTHTDRSFPENKLNSDTLHFIIYPIHCQCFNMLKYCEFGIKSGKNGGS